jgi:hypothetical protein
VPDCTSKVVTMNLPPDARVDEDVEQRKRQRDPTCSRTCDANRICESTNEMNDEREGTNYQQPRIQIDSPQNRVSRR